MREDLHGDVKPRFAAPPPVINTDIRRAVDEDKPFMLDLAREMYSVRVVADSIRWVEWCMQNPERLVLVGPNSFGIAQADWVYGFQRRGRLDLLACRTTRWATFEPLRMIRLMIAWAKEKGCTGTFKLDADTGIDFTPFAARLGGYPVDVQRCEIPIT